MAWPPARLVSRGSGGRPEAAVWAAAQRQIMEEVAAFVDERSVHVGEEAEGGTAGFLPPAKDDRPQLGWLPGPDDRYGNPDHPWNVAWREHHRLHSGIKGLELYDALEEGFEVGAAANFHRDGVRCPSALAPTSQTPLAAAAAQRWLAAGRWPLAAGRWPLAAAAAALPAGRPLPSPLAAR